MLKHWKWILLAALGAVVLWQWRDYATRTKSGEETPESWYPFRGINLFGLDLDSISGRYWHRIT